MRYRIAYVHSSDGSGWVTRHRDRPLDEATALMLAADMRSSAGYEAVTIEAQPRLGARWETVSANA